MCGIVWSILLFILTSNTPKTHRFISKTEREYIIEETKKTIETRKICQTVRY